MDNLDLWNQVSRTDPAYTKTANVNGQQITSISGTSVVLKATEMFGPVGIGWGYEIVEERFDDAGPILVKAEDSESYSEVGRQVMHTARVRIWYHLEGQKGEIQHLGHTPYVYRSRYGATTDMEAPKKSVTDALKKALSMLGFNADIFLGEYDDPEYVRAQRTRSDIERSENRAEALTKAQEEFDEWLSARSRDVELCPHISSIKRLMTKVNEQAPRRAEAAEYPKDRYDVLMNRIHTVAEQTMKAIQESQENGNG